MQDDDRPLLGFETAEAALELVAVGDRRRGVGDGGWVREVGDVDVEATAADAPDLIDAGVHQQATQPGVESVRVAQRGQITPGTDEGVLDGVRRPIRIPEHEPGGRVEAGDRGACQLGEGVMIAPPRSLHEVSRHHGPQAVARLRWPRSLSMARGSTGTASLSFEVRRACLQSALAWSHSQARSVIPDAWTSAATSRPT